MNLADPELELIDPTPNVYALFIQFDKVFFWTKLASRAAVRWSKRMYSCAGVCSYEGYGGLVDIALSEPLLKLRPRKDLVETLLHEMIHAYLFVTCRDQDRDGHGPNFKAHMHRINNLAGLNISIYHDFHDEVKLYQTHWWRCNGPCQSRRPHFGIVRRSANRPPGPNDYWWNDHKRKCGGTFTKIKEPEPKVKKTEAPKKPNADITKYITKTNNNNVTKPVLKDSNPIKTKSNSSSTLVITKKEPAFNPQYKKPPVPFEGKGQTLLGQSSSKPANVVEAVRNVWANKQIQITHTSDKNDNITETVRNIWANKQLPDALTYNNNNKVNGKQKTMNNAANNSRTSNKHKSESDIKSPPAKIKKIDDYFKATSVLKDLYGDNITLQANDDKKLVAVTNKADKIILDSKVNSVIVKVESVCCPICNAKVRNQEINRHLDECLNKEAIENICTEVKENCQTTVPTNQNMPVRIKEENIIVIEEKYTNSPYNTADGFIIKKGTSNKPKLEDIPYLDTANKAPKIKTEPGTAEIIDVTNCPKIKIEQGTPENINVTDCACCGETINKPLSQHLDECLAFFGNCSQDGASTSTAVETIIIDDDDENDVFDESLTLNASGTKVPCPCCLEMVEEAEMNEHLDRCLS